MCVLGTFVLVYEEKPYGKSYLTNSLNVYFSVSKFYFPLEKRLKEEKF